MKVSHILIKTPLAGADGKVDEKGVAEAQKRAEDVLKQLKAGAKFEDLAKKYSEDPGSAKEGGSLGWIGKGRTVPEFEKAAFSLPKGQISDLVKSSYGFHIIRVDDKQEAHMKTLDEVKGRDRAHPEAAEGAGDRAEAGGRFAGAGKDAGVGCRRGGEGRAGCNFGLLQPQGYGTGIRAGAAVHGRSVHGSGKVAAEMAATSQGFAVFQLLAVKPPRRRLSMRFARAWRSNSRASARTFCLSQKTQELSDRAKSEHDLKKAAKELGATVKTSDFVAARWSGSRYRFDDRCRRRLPLA